MKKKTVQSKVQTGGGAGGNKGKEEEWKERRRGSCPHFSVGVVDTAELMTGVQGPDTLLPGVPGVTNRPGGRGLVVLTFAPWLPPESRPPRVVGTFIAILYLNSNLVVSTAIYSPCGLPDMSTVLAWSCLSFASLSAITPVPPRDSTRDCTLSVVGVAINQRGRGKNWRPAKIIW